jgi:hypothetical protein
MQARDYEFYIARAKEAQGFKYDNQLDMALGFKGSMMAIVKKGNKHLSDQKMIELAKLAGIDEAIALMDLNIWRSGNDEVKNAYKGMAEKLKINLLNMFLGILTISFLSLSAPAMAKPLTIDKKCQVISASLYSM